MPRFDRGWAGLLNGTSPEPSCAQGHAPCQTQNVTSPETATMMRMGSVAACRPDDLKSTCTIGQPLRHSFAPSARSDSTRVIAQPSGFSPTRLWSCIASTSCRQDLESRASDTCRAAFPDESSFTKATPRRQSPNGRTRQVASSLATSFTWTGATATSTSFRTCSTCCPSPAGPPSWRGSTTHAIPTIAMPTVEGTWRSIRRWRYATSSARATSRRLCSSTKGHASSPSSACWTRRSPATVLVPLTTPCHAQVHARGGEGPRGSSTCCWRCARATVAEPEAAVRARRAAVRHQGPEDRERAVPPGDDQGPAGDARGADLCSA